MSYRVFVEFEASPRRMTEAEACFVGAERPSSTSAVRSDQRAVAERLVFGLKCLNIRAAIASTSLAYSCGEL